jgi:DNA-directed RNA polymerase subunit RPC12/RpoP
METAVMTFVIVLVAFVAVAMIYGRYMEKKDWNNGVCSCGEGFWRSFDVDSSGTRGYRCTACGRHIWISWRFLKGADGL